MTHINHHLRDTDGLKFLDSVEEGNDACGDYVDSIGEGVETRCFDQAKMIRVVIMEKGIAVGVVGGEAAGDVITGLGSKLVTYGRLGKD